jgi:IS5 family transposase
LVHGDETDVFGDAGYQGVDKHDETQDVTANWHIAMRPLLDRFGRVSDRCTLKAAVRLEDEREYKRVL